MDICTRQIGFAGRILRLALGALLLGVVFGQMPAQATPITPFGVVARQSGSPTQGYAINVTWLISASSPSPAGYNIYRSTTSGGLTLYASYSQYDSNSSFTDTNVVSGQTYYYAITQVDINAGQESGMSQEVSATPGAAALAAPILSGTFMDNQTTLKWSSVSGATFYNVYRALYGGTYALLANDVTATTYTDTSAVNGQTYLYVVTPDNANGESRASNAFQITPGQSPDLPAPPDLIATVGGDPINGYSVTLNWTEPTNRTNYFNHLIYRGQVGGGEAQIAYADDTSDYYYGGQTAAYTDTNLVAGQTYYYKISVVDSTGESPRSAEVSVTIGKPTVPAPVLSGTRGNTLNALSWTAVSGNGHPTFYNIYRANYNSDSYHFLVSGLTGTTYTDTGLTNGTTYHYIVCADNANGQGPGSNAVYLTAGNAPDLPAPDSLTATPGGSPTGGYNITLHWTKPANVNNANYHFYIYRTTVSGAEAPPYYYDDGNDYNNYNGQQGTFTDTSVTAGVTYYYTVSAVDPSGEGPMSGEASAIGGSVPLAAPVLRGTPGLSQNVLRWNAVSGAASYNIYRGDLFGNNVLQLVSDVTATTYTDSSAVNGTSYSYYVCAENAAGQGAASNLVYLTPGISDLPAPSGVIAVANGTAASGYSIAVSWNFQPSIYTYYIYRSTTPGGETTPVYSNNTGNNYGLSNSYYFNDTHVQPGITYYYEVSAVDTTGESPRSLEVSARPGGTPPVAPVLTGTPGAAQCNLSWNSVPGAVTYNVFRSDFYYNYTILLASGLTTPGYSDTTVTDGTTYHYYVTAISGDGEGKASNTVQVTSGIPDLPAPTGVTATASGSATSGYQITLEWTDVPNITNYFVYRSTTPGGEGKVLYATYAYHSYDLYNASYYTDTHITAGVTYYYKITAVDSDGEGPASTEVSAKAASAPLTAPVLTGTPANNESKLSWTAVSGAATYNIYKADFYYNYITLLASGLTATTYNDTAITNGTTYHYFVRAISALGQGNASNTVQVTPGTPSLAAPTGVTATASGSATSGYQITLEWTDVPNATNYYIYRATKSGGEGKVLYATYAYHSYDLYNASYYTDSHVVANTTYYYTVTAVGSPGEGPASAEVSAKAASVALAAPVLTGTPAAGQSKLSWTAVSGAATYNIYKADFYYNYTTLLASGLTGTTYNDTKVTNGTTYHYFVRAESALGQGAASNTVQVTPGTPDLPAPKGLTATASGNATSGYAITVQWNTVTNAASYYIYRSTTAGGEGKIVYATGTGYGGGLYNSYYETDTHVTAGVTYYYKVTALDSHGESPQSAEVSAKCAAAPLAAPTLTGTPAAGQCKLSWTAVSGATTYNVYKADFYYNYITLLASGLTTTAYNDTAVTNGTTYHYYVRAENATGQGTASNTVQVTAGVPDLASPKGLTATASGNATNGYAITVQWNTVTNATNYYVYRATTPGGEGKVIYAIYTGYGGGLYNSDYYTDTGVTAGVTYYYKVTALDSHGESPQSVEVSAQAASAPLSAPVLSFTTTGNKSNMTWAAVSGATNYNIYRSDQNSNYVILLASGQTALKYTDSGSVHGTTYLYYVCADNANGQGTASNTVTVTP